mmetsp:Transcript_6815/g.13994  ORF Transcript_6815/g.13994 Transcript_6815/m.13994 type:complete len:99 (-) Transcript_6815:2622-2918(-)
MAPTEDVLTSPEQAFDLRHMLFKVVKRFHLQHIGLATMHASVHWEVLPCAIFVPLFDALFLEAVVYDEDYTNKASSATNEAVGDLNQATMSFSNRCGG